MSKNPTKINNFIPLKCLVMQLFLGFGEALERFNYNQERWFQICERGLRRHTTARHASLCRDLCDINMFDHDGALKWLELLRGSILLLFFL